MYRVLLVCYLVSVYAGVIMTRSVLINSDTSGGLQLDGGVYGGENIHAGDRDLVSGTRLRNVPLDNEVLLHKDSSAHHSSENDYLRHSNTTLTPDYMIELYETLSKAPPLKQTANIIRSFKNKATEGKSSKCLSLLCFFLNLVCSEIKCLVNFYHAPTNDALSTEKQFCFDID